VSTKDLAQAIKENPDPSGTLRIGVITAVGTDPARKVKTDQTGNAWLSRDQDTWLAVDDRVWMIQQGATFLVGGRLSGSLSQPICKRKAAVQTVTSSITPVNDTSLLQALPPGAYRVQLFAHFSSPSAAADLRSKWTYSGTTTTNGRACIGPGSVTTAAEGQSSGSVTRSSGHGFGTEVVYGTDAGLSAGVLHEDLVLIPTTSGILQWQWAQGTSDANATTVSVASRLYITPIFFT